MSNEVLHLCGSLAMYEMGIVLLLLCMMSLSCIIYDLALQYLITSQAENFPLGKTGVMCTDHPERVFLPNPPPSRRKW